MLTEKEADDDIADLAEELGAPCWHDLLEKDDRTSPEEYPDHCLISRDELIEYIKVALDMGMDPKAYALHRLAVAAERERIAKGLEAEADNSPCAEDASVHRGAAWLVRADFSYEEADRLQTAAEQSVQSIT